MRIFETARKSRRERTLDCGLTIQPGQRYVRYFIVGGEEPNECFTLCCGCAYGPGHNCRDVNQEHAWAEFTPLDEEETGVWLYCTKCGEERPKLHSV